MKYSGFIKKSRTFDTASLVIAFGVIEQNLPMLREQLGDYYGIVFICIGVIFAVLRQGTKGAVGEK